MEVKGVSFTQHSQINFNCVIGLLIIVLIVL